MSVPFGGRDPVVIIAGTPWDGMLASERQLGAQLAAFGPVVYVDPPVSRSWPTLSRPQIDQPHPGVTRITPNGVRGMYRPLAHHAIAPLVAHAVKRQLNLAGVKPRAVMVAAPLAILSHFPESRHIVYATDDWIVGAGLMGLPEDRMRWVQRRHLETADLVIAVSDVLAERYRSAGHPAVEVVANGCDLDTLDGVDRAQPVQNVDLPKPIAGFLGNLSDRIDLSYLEAVAERGVSTLLVGPRRAQFGGDRFDRLVARPNVRWVGPQPYERMPSYLRLIDVGMTPYSPTEFNKSSSPLKTLEYLAAGRGSVATDLPGVRSLGTPLVAIETNPEAFADAVEATLAMDRTPELVAARRAAAAPHSWERKALRVADLLGLATPVNLP
ncbi:glycosyltransferase [Methylocapsa palsarum]|nr:glycosyltransferase [Methylocapsa palsarum]